MLNGRTILLGILWVFFFLAAAFGQDPSNSQVVTVTEKIDLAELNNSVKTLNGNVEKLTENMEKLTENMEKLTEGINGLNTRVAVLEERTRGTAKAVHVILASIIAPLVIVVAQKLMDRNGAGKVTSANTAQANQSETALTNPAQLSENETTRTPILSPKLPDGEELKEYMRSDSHATKETV